MNGRDPGWKPVLKLYTGRLLAPWKWSTRRQSSEELSRLTQMRLVWLALVITPFLYLLVLSRIEPLRGDEGPFLWIIIGIGIASVAAGIVVRNQPLTVDSPETLVGSYTKWFYIGFVISEVPMLFAFIGAIAQQATWLYIVGLPFGLLGLAMCGPLRANLERYDRSLREKGSRYRLTELMAHQVALPGPPEKPPGPPV